MKVLGILVSYNPDILLLEENVKLISQEVTKLVIIDNNSTNKNLLQIFSVYDNVEVIYNDENEGLGKAYNIVLRTFCDKFEAFVTFDQDTKIPLGTVKGLYKCLFSNDKTGVVGPCFSRDKEKIGEGRLINKTVIIQSCALFRMELFPKIGGFNEDYFIDSVDFEYCLRIKKSKYSVKIFNGIWIKHNLGDEKIINGRKIIIHNNLRNYYMARNHMRLLKTYAFQFPFFSIKLHYFFLKHIFEVCLIEKDLKKFLVICKGIVNMKYE